MIDSVLAPKLAPYIVNHTLQKQDIVFFVYILCMPKCCKAKKSRNNYRLKTMLATENRSSSNFLPFFPTYSRFIPSLPSDIVLPALQNSTGQTPKTPIRGNGEGLSGAYKRTLAMRRLLKAILRAKDIDIFVAKEHGRMPTILDIQGHPPRQGEGGMVTDYELRYLRTVVYASITK
jgi:hypothetical protein